MYFYAGKVSHNIEKKVEHFNETISIWLGISTHTRSYVKSGFSVTKRVTFVLESEMVTVKAKRMEDAPKCS